MIQIRILDKSYTPLTTLNTGEFTGLQYKKTLGQIGDASFSIPISNSKISTISLRNYNRIEILDGGVIQWVGYIATKQITFNEVTVKCTELIGILSKRITTNAYVMNGDAGILISNLLTAINAIDDTGITMGETDVSTSINLTFNQQDIFTVLQNIADTTQAQFKLNTDRTLDFKLNIGEDLSTSKAFEYNTSQPQQANILKFNVEDNGVNITTKSFGSNTSLTSTQSDTDLINKYGVLEKFDSFPQTNNQGSLDQLTLSRIKDTLYSPSIDLIPGELDNFDIGDIVKINIKNKLVVINDSFQILEKNVKIISSQKSISVKINQLSQDISNDIRNLQRQVNLLITN